MFNSSSKFQRLVKGKMWKRWQLCHATNFQSLMYPCFIVSRILGTFPYKFNLWTFETSKQCYIQLIVLICIFSVCDLLILHGIIVFKKFGFEDVTQILEAICYFAFGGFIAIVTYILTGPRMRLLQTIREISSRLPPESYQKLSRLIHVKDILGTFLIVMQSCIFCYRNTYNTPLLIHVFTMYISLLVFQMDMQYMNCVCVIKACFKRINDSLMHMQKLLINNESHVPRLICHTQRNQFLLIKLKTLKKQHLMISDTVQMLNVIFSLQLLATIVLTFTETTFELYSHVLRWQDGLSINLNEIHDVYFIISIPYDIIKLTLIVWACETGKNQAFEIGTTVHDVFNSTSDEQIKEELQLFSLQILHRKNIFSTKGLNVDATLLAAMIGNITTYMLILVQFLISSHSCDRKNASHISPID